MQSAELCCSSGHCAFALLSSYEHVGSDSVCVQAALDAADVTGGLSLGEYTALTFAGAMRYNTVAVLVRTGIHITCRLFP